MSTIPVQERHTCTCGHADESLPTLDARSIPHELRHAAILGAVGSLAPGRAMALVAPHDPQPLLTQISQVFGPAIEVSYLVTGPEAWTVKFARA
ncbi:MAG: DUF2249 domain-containing protein [Propionibacteriaceae bacterium]|jgi:uncharacterized protein (DUF2249 family)|nr:DUF2249 domain-containing protein [Propionibacteriaceae bacterium]